MIFPGGQKGWFTVVDSPTGLTYIKLSDKEVKIVRLLGGFVFDREAFSGLVLMLCSAFEEKKFVQFKTYRLLVPPKMSECQYTGWKGTEP
jgi:hypothetical protein